MNKSVPAVGQPWWKFGHVWLVLAGPAVVVVAGFVTLYLAVRSPDPVVADDYYRQGMELNKTLDGGGNSRAPALQARNHAATGGGPPLAQAAARP